MAVSSDCISKLSVDDGGRTCCDVYDARSSQCLTSEPVDAMLGLQATKTLGDASIKNTLLTSVPPNHCVDMADYPQCLYM